MSVFACSAFRAATFVCLGLCTPVLLFCVPRTLAQEVPEDPTDLIGDLPRERRAQTGMAFLSVSIDPRAAALGNVATAWDDGGSHSLFYNPASMAWTDNTFHAAFGHMEWIADTGYDYASLALQPFDGRYGVLGFSFLMVNYGEFQGTIRADNDQGYIDTYTFSPSAWAFGVGYARAVAERFSVGGHVRYVSQSLGTGVMGVGEDGRLTQKDFAQGVLAFDFGVLLRTGFRGLIFAVSVRNLGPEVTYVEDNFELPLTFQIGTTIDVNRLARLNLDPDVHAVRLLVDAVRPRDFSEHFEIGGEYVFMNTLALRAGYAYPAGERGVNLGAGFQLPVGGIQFKADYAYTRFGVFGHVHRVGLKLGF